jgi:hypothetical protein
MIATWQAPLPGGGQSEELLVAFDRQREQRVLVLPAMFDEANKLRRFTVQAMRALDAAGIDTFLPDLPGCNESLAPLEAQTLDGWAEAADAAAMAFEATHVLTMRAGALLASARLPGWRYAPQSGPRLLRAMIRARTIAAREAGRSESSDQLLATGRERGIMLAGWPIGADLLRSLEAAEIVELSGQRTIEPAELNGPGLWLRAEPGEDPRQSEALAAIVAGEAEVVA